MDLMDVNKVNPQILRRYVAAGDKIRLEANMIFHLTRQLELSDARDVVQIGRASCRERV